MLWVILLPTFSPMGVMLISAPRVKNIIPSITKTEPNRKLKRTLGLTGAIVRLSTSTMAMTGATATSASFNLLCILGFQNFKTLPPE